jgi:alcohol dehydrogenase class IV
MPFEFYNPCRVVSGDGALSRIGGLAISYGKKALLLAYEGLSVNLKNIVVKNLEEEGLAYKFVAAARGEPTDTGVMDIARQAREFGAEIMISIGGGSVTDTVKAAAAMAGNEGDIKEYLEGVGTGRVFQNTPLPFIAVPTTAGTGAEATKNAVIMGSGEAAYKKSLRDDRLYAKAVVISPLLYLTMPRRVTAESGMDALTQLIESYASRKATPVSRAWSYEGLKHIRSLKTCYNDGLNLAAREQTAVAAYMSGVALSSGGLGAVHGIAGTFGAYTGLAHGLICAVLLPHVIRLNSPVAAGYAEIADVLCGAQGTDAQKYTALIEYTEGLNAHFSIPRDFTGCGITEAKLEKIAAESRGSNMDANPVPLSEKDTFDFLRPLCIRN